MTVGMIAFHYPKPAHFEEFVARVHRVRDVFLATPGCLSAEVWTTPDDEAVVSTVTWESDAAFAASFAVVNESAGDDIVFDERESRPREITRLRSR
ncbi:antibiotic biosynthesis monooxygenase [Saccharopolyspora sp. NPDC050389]|uniref:antibiotic biosynthesis monooxygenase family protein n=1 Tax=Saccharopolyspora sp. NPDC050389 TaxID=3155516 RepID=UPI0033E8E7C3